MPKSIDGMRIKCAAIRYGKEIYEGDAHCSIGLYMVEMGICKSPYPSGDAQGFVTECGKFVTRGAAYAIARNAGQINVGKTVHPSMLFSEDLKA